MSLPVVYRLAASRETIEAARSYERLRPGLGISFLDELARIERHLSSSPGLYQIAEGQIRRADFRLVSFISRRQTAFLFWRASIYGAILKPSVIWSGIGRSLLQV